MIVLGGLIAQHSLDEGFLQKGHVNLQSSLHLKAGQDHVELFLFNRVLQEATGNSWEKHILEQSKAGQEQALRACCLQQPLKMLAWSAPAFTGKREEA